MKSLNKEKSCKGMMEDCLKQNAYGQMLKKNSNEIKSRNWRLPVDSIAIVEDYGQMKGVPCVEKLENGGFKFNKQ